MVPDPEGQIGKPDPHTRRASRCMYLGHQHTPSALVYRLFHYRVHGTGYRVQGTGYMVGGVGVVRVQGTWRRVQGIGYMVQVVGVVRVQVGLDQTFH